MQYLYKRLLKILIIPTFCILGTSLNANAALLLNGDFENGNDGSWSLFEEAFYESANPIQGLLSGLLGNIQVSSGASYSVISQTVAVDGTDFAAGDTIQLDALMKFLTSAAPFANTYIELAFRNGDASSWVSDISDVDFGNANLVYLTSTDGSVQALSTGGVVIPNQIVTSALTGAVTGIRVAIAMGPFNGNDAQTRAMVDNVTLTRTARPVPAPAMLFLLGLPLLLLSRINRA